MIAVPRPSERAVDHGGHERGVLGFVEHVRRDHEIEPPDVVRKATPVRGARLDELTGVHEHVQRGEAERLVIVVRCCDVEPGDCGSHRHESRAAAHLETTGGRPRGS